MRLSKVIAYDPTTKERQIFTFGTASDGKSVVANKGGRLNGYLEFCFNEDVANARDVETEFLLNTDEYSLGRIHGEDGTVRSVLKKRVDGRWQVVARSKALGYLQTLINRQVSEVMKDDYVSNKVVENFHGDLTLFDEIRLLSEVDAGVSRTSEEARALRENAVKKVQEYSAQMANEREVASADSLDRLSSDIAEVNELIARVTAKLGEARSAQSANLIRDGIAKELDATQQRYNKLLARQDEIEILRQRVKLRNDIDALVPKVRTLRAIAEQRAEYEKKRYSVTTELEWQEKELNSVKQQLDECRLRLAKNDDKRTRLEAINNELTYIASLYEKNKKLNEMLVELNEAQQRFESEKVMCQNKLDAVEKSIAEIKEGLDGFRVPVKSVGELLETVRVDVKIDEVSAQVEKLQSEIAVKESQIAERESKLVAQVKRFRSVADLDTQISPVKAKDAILQVLDAKCSKLETINTSLAEKVRNLQRALEDYKYRLLQLDSSKAQLEAQLDKLMLRKQEEFKREVYLNSQKVFADDATGVFAVNADFNDQEVAAMKAEIEARNLDRELLLERTYKLEGAIKEINRNIDINSAEIQTLRRERENIVARYNEILQQNSSEAVFNYVKALAADNATKYLLDVQQEAVRAESELAELKRYTETLRTKLGSLKSRLQYLKDTQRQLDDTRSSIDALVVTNDRLKDELADMGDRLSAGYEQYKAITRQMENIESKLEDIRGAVVETTRTVKVNEQQIEQATERAKKYAGSDDLEQAIAEFRYEADDAENELQMLTDTKNNLEKDVFKKRLELEKMQWLYDSKVKEYSELYQELSFEFRVKGLDVDKLNGLDIDADMEPVARVIAAYDTTKGNLADRIQSLYALIKNQPEQTAVNDRTVAVYEQQLAALRDRQAKLEAQRREQTERLVEQNNQRVRVTVAAAEARTLSTLKESFSHSDIVSLLIKDKVGTLLATATTYLNVLTKGNYKITQEGYKVSVADGETTTAYDDLATELKTATYIALLLAVPTADSSEGRWVVFEDRLNIDKQALSEMLLAIDNVSYVVDYTREKGEKPTMQAEA